MVENQQVFKTPSANVAVTMANLERLPNMLEYQDVRTNIRAHLIAAMGANSGTSQASPSLFLYACHL